MRSIFLVKYGEKWFSTKLIKVDNESTHDHHAQLVIVDFKPLKLKKIKKIVSTWHYGFWLKLQLKYIAANCG